MKFGILNENGTSLCGVLHNSLLAAPAEFSAAYCRNCAKRAGLVDGGRLEVNFSRSIAKACNYRKDGEHAVRSRAILDALNVQGASAWWASQYAPSFAPDVVFGDDDDVIRAAVEVKGPHTNVNATTCATLRKLGAASLSPKDLPDFPSQEFDGPHSPENCHCEAHQYIRRRSDGYVVGAMHQGDAYVRYPEIWSKRAYEEFTVGDASSIIYILLAPKARTAVFFDWIQNADRWTAAPLEDFLLKMQEFGDEQKDVLVRDVVNHGWALLDQGSKTGRRAV